MRSVRIARHHLSTTPRNPIPPLAARPLQKRPAKGGSPMKRIFTTCSLLVRAACFDQNATRTDERTHRLDDLDRDGLLEEEGGGVIMPDPGDCPVMTYTEMHTVTVDESGMVISETWEVCTQCF